MKILKICFLICSLTTLPGCFAQRREVIIVFPGEDIIAQVATNEKIPLVVKNGDKAETVNKDVGQAVVIPLHQYRAMRARILALDEKATP